MAKKVTIKFDKRYEVGGVVLEGEKEYPKPTAGQIIDAADLCSPTNPIGYGTAVISVVAGIPYNALRDLELDEFDSLMECFRPLVPNG